MTLTLFHGTHAAYTKGCRCENCCHASRNYKRQQRGLPPVRYNPYGLPVLAPMGAWVEQAKCRGADQAAFFEESGGMNAEERAARLCAGCPVTTECLDDALRNDIRDGVWGGTTPKQRKAICRKWREAS